MNRFERISRAGYASAVFLLALVVWAPPAESSKRLGCVDVTDTQVADLFVQWNDALKTLNPDKVVDLYAQDAVLLPTVENGPLIGRAAIREYFVHFLENKPTGKIDEHTIRIGCNVAFDAGLYTFTFGTSGAVTPARYTYIYEYQEGRWLIVHHHSSKQPVAPKPKP